MPSRPRAAIVAHVFRARNGRVCSRPYSAKRAHLRARALAQVWRDDAERLAQVVGAAHQRAAGVDRDAEPLVRVERQRVGALHAPVARGQRRVEHAEGAIGAIDVEPEPLGGGDFGERVERVDRAGVHGSRRAHEQSRRRAGRAVGGDRAAQRVRVETPAGQRHRPDAVAPEPEQLERARHAAVRLGGHVGNEARAAREAAPAHVVPRGGEGATAGAGQADDRRRGCPARQEPGARRVRVPDELRQPPHGRALEVNVGVVARHHARVHRGGRQRRQHTGQRRRGVDPAEERRVPVAHRVWQTSRAMLAANASSPVGPSGSGSASSAARRSSGSGCQTGRPGSAARWSATASTSVWPARRNASRSPVPSSRAAGWLTP